MRSRLTLHDRASERPYFDGRTTWRGVAAGYGLMLFVLALIWALNDPLLAAILFVFGVGTYAVIRVCTRGVRQPVWRTVWIPGTDIYVTIYVR